MRSCGKINRTKKILFAIPKNKRAKLMFAVYLLGKDEARSALVYQPSTRASSLVFPLCSFAWSCRRATMMGRGRQIKFTTFYWCLLEFFSTVKRQRSLRRSRVGEEKHSEQRNSREILRLNNSARDGWWACSSINNFKLSAALLAWRGVPVIGGGRNNSR